MSLINVEKTIDLDIYDHDTTPSAIKAIQMDAGTRTVFAVIRNSGQTYDIGQNASVSLIVLRPDKTKVQITGEPYPITETTMDGETITYYGVSAELTQLALAVKGNLKAQFKITSGEQELRTEIFTINNGEALDADDGDWAGDLDGHNLDEMAQDIEDTKAAVSEMETDVSDLKSGLSEFKEDTWNTNQSLATKLVTATGNADLSEHVGGLENKISKGENLADFFEKSEAIPTINVDISEQVQEEIHNTSDIAEVLIDNSETDEGNYTVIGLDPTIAETIEKLVDDVSKLNSSKAPFPISPLSKYGSAGQVLSTNGDGTTTWVNSTVPDPVDVANAVNDWLSEHPEATTTVAEHSLTHEKLVNGTLNFVTPEMYGAVCDGETDDSDAIQMAIDSGYNVLFKNGTYLVAKTLNITRSNIILDFNGADIICTANTFINSLSEFDTTVYTGAYTVNSRKGYGTENGLTLVTSEEKAQTGRSYYICGMVCDSVDNSLNASLPYSITNCTIKKQSKPINNIVIRNIGSYTNYNSEMYHTSTISFTGISDSIIENCNLIPNNHNYIGVNLIRCSNIVVRNCVIGIRNSDSQNTYGIDVTACSYTTIDSCRMYSNKWHCITTGGSETTLYTYVLNSVLSLSENATTQSAYSDHGNALYTKLFNCKTIGQITIADGVVDNCEMMPNNHNGNSNGVGVILFAWVGDKVKNNFVVSNIRAHGTFVVLISKDAQNEQENLTLNCNSVTVSNIIADQSKITTITSALSSNYTNVEFNELTVNKFNGSIDMLQVFKTIKASQCVFTDIDYRESPYDSWITHNPVLILSDCTCAAIKNRLFGIILQASNCQFYDFFDYGETLPSMVLIANCVNNKTTAVTIKASTVFQILNCIFKSPNFVLQASTGIVKGENLTTLSQTQSEFPCDIYKEADGSVYSVKKSPTSDWQTISI